jgi:nitrite reductase (NADH) small subunit
MTIQVTNDFPTREQNGATFVEVCASRDVLRRKGTLVSFDGADFDDPVEIAIVRSGDALRAVNNICPHQHAPSLFEGEVNAQDDTITCPLHGWTYSLETGICTSSAHSRVQIYRVFEEHGMVWLEKPAPMRVAWKW